ncbi:carboxypeptidase-like regulatory domain-containing protein [Methanomassiliicoccus luminyensis]|uniref:carboxypeptidase-like regulatory domain-containing protein n=1 Tax=Methanomassiliicoccus luminyensis TaxID=1080712 RepID=UPI00036F451D|nr:carboxypeptidase-like regulatory domain-containing protein [Methanomassiliicoccus luminyensis]
MKAVSLVLCFALLATVLTGGTALAEEDASILGEFSVVGLVEDADGNGLGGVNITAVYASNGTHIVSTLTDSGGGYTLPLATGVYNISATLKDHRANTTYHGISEGGGLDFTMYEVLGTVTGQVVDAISTVANVTITLSNGTASYGAVSTAPFGNFTIENVTPGLYLLRAEKEGYNISFSEVDVKRGVVSNVLIVMAEQPSWLVGKVTYDGTPLEGVLVTLESKGGLRYTNVTDDDGGYYFKVPSGEYTITFSKSGFVTSTMTKILFPLRENTANVELKKSTLPGNSGFIRDYDMPHSMMVVGLSMSLVTIISALFLRYRVRLKPELLTKRGDEEK